MDRPPPTLDRARVQETLVTVLDHAMPTCARIDYRLVGTGAALLHGVRLPAADVDILVKERASVDGFGSALSSFRCLFEPAWLPEARQYYGNYDVNGVEVGISTVEVETDADTIETFGRGPWVHFALLPCGSHSVPTVSLELRLITELSRNRSDRYGPIIQHMQAYGCDIELMRRGMNAAGLPEDLRNDVLRRLSSGRKQKRGSRLCASPFPRFRQFQLDFHADLDAPVPGHAGAGRDELPDDHVLLEPDQRIHLALRGRVGQHARRLLERRRGQEALGRQ